MLTERRRCVRHKVNGPAFASFDGVTGGMILDLSDQGLCMQTLAPLDRDRHLDLRLDLPNSEAPVETTGYVAWADALGRAGVRFSELPEDARSRLDHWLAEHEQAPSRKAPKLVVDRVLATAQGESSASDWYKTRAISLEADGSETPGARVPSTSIQYEFRDLGPDLNGALQLISERARSLLRASGAAIALTDGGPMICRASVGVGGPALGTRVDFNSGFTGECVRAGRALRCDDAESDPRVDAEICEHLNIRSIAGAPVRYEREVVGLVEVFSSQTFAFDEGDLAILERLAQTVLLTVRQMQLPRAPQMQASSTAL